VTERWSARQRSKMGRDIVRELWIWIFSFSMRSISQPSDSKCHPLIMERDFVIEPTCELLQCSKDALAQKIDEIYG